MAANPFGIHDFEKKPAATGDFTLESGKDLELCYRFVFHPGDHEEADIAGMYREYAGRSDP